MIVAVIPAYNEDTRIASVVRAVKDFVDAVLVIDDGSTDATGEEAKKAGATVVRHIENCGAGAATMTGIEAARLMGAGIVITIDADEQHDPKDIPVLLAPLKRGEADIVLPNRFGNRNNIPLIRRLFNQIGNLITLLATGRWVNDSQNGLKAFGPKALGEIDLKMSGFEFCTEIVRESVRHNWRIMEVPSKVIYSAYSLAKGQSFANGMRTAFKILLRSFLR